MVHTTLSQGKHIAEEKSLFESKWKGQKNIVLLEPKCKGQTKSVLFESKWKGQENSIVRAQSVRDRKHCRPRSKDRVTNLYV